MASKGEEYVDEALEEGTEESDEGIADPELAELAKPTVMKWRDAYASFANKPVELVVPTRADCFKVIGDVAEARYPAKKVARSAHALAATLRGMFVKKS
ncbi:MAG: hypothetical protein IPJ65_11065 [Archangiaceae bacterium]|nr:hypothetical protein [Archangiaceae bacterium]